MSTTPIDRRAVTARYDAVAGAYGTSWAPVLLPVATELVRPLPLAGASVVVDAAAGTGGLLPTLATLAPDAVVLALDASHGMLRHAVGHPRAQADCTALPLRDGAVDAVVLAFVLFHVADRERALREAARVLRPGGWVATATWAAGESSPHDDAFVGALDALGAPPAPPVRDDTGIDSPAGITRLLARAGFRDVATAITRIHYAPTVDDYLAWRLAGGPLRDRYAALPAAERAEVLRRTRAALEALSEAERVDRSEVVLARAARPTAGAGAVGP